MAKEPSWDEIFRPEDPERPERPERPEPREPAPQEPAAASPETADPRIGVRASDPFAVAAAEARAAQSTAGDRLPLTRRELLDRERESGGTRPPAKKRRRAWPWVLLVIVALLAAGGAAGWALFEDRIRAVLGWEEPIDYVGQGNGTEIEVTIISGQIGEDIAVTLFEAGVTKTFDAFYGLLLGLEEQPVFVPGTYLLQEEMSAEAALAALLDEDNRQINAVAIREGLTVPQSVELLSAGTGIAAADFEAALVDPASYGIPAGAPNFEGYLFPANYQFDPGVTARDIIQALVNRTFESLDAAGVPVENRHEVLTIASLIQREARLSDDFYKVSRVIQNRLADGMRLEFDSTAHYGAGGASGSVFTTDEERAAVNDYNTYVIPALPIGPIAGAGDLAIDAAMNPVDGPWLFFVTVNLDTGETVFTTTVGEHEAAVEQLREWCRESDSAACD